MKKSAANVQSFLKSLALLLLALLVTLIVLFPRSSSFLTVDAGATEPPKKRGANVATSTKESAATALPSTATEPLGQVNARERTQAAAEGDAKITTLRQAESLADAGNIHEAVEVLEVLLQADPKNESALIQMGQIQYLDLQDPGQAIGYFQRAITENPNNQLVMADLLSLWDSQGQVSEGLIFLRELKKQYPASVELDRAIGQMLSIAGLSKEGAQDARYKALANHNESP